MLIRNILFARLLSPHDFAIALTFGITLSLLEYISTLGHELFMQRAEQGDEERFQATMQSFTVLRGIVIASILIVISPLIPDFFKLPEETFNYALLAIVPLINGFIHLDPQRAHRNNNFYTTAKIGITADISSIMMAMLCLLVWENYWAFYFSFIFRHSISTVLSHYFAERPYQLACDKAYLHELCRFGIPLLFIGIIKYCGTEIDKVLITRYYGLEMLTLYFITIMITSNTTNIVSIGLSKIFIRRISTAKTDALRHTVYGNGIIIFYLITPILLGITLFGEEIILLVFGNQYSPIPYLFPAIVTLMLFRQLCGWLNQIVVGTATTTWMLYANIVRAMVLVVVLTVIIEHQDIRLFSLGFVLGEIAYFVFLSLLIAGRITQLSGTSTLLFSLSVVFASGFAGLYWFTQQMNLLDKILCYSISLLILMSLFNLLFAPCREQTLKALTALHSVIKKST